MPSRLHRARFSSSHHHFRVARISWPTLLVFRQHTEHHRRHRSANTAHRKHTADNYADNERCVGARGGGFAGFQLAALLAAKAEKVFECALGKLKEVDHQRAEVVDLANLRLVVAEKDNPRKRKRIGILRCCCCCCCFFWQSNTSQLIIIIQPSRENAKQNNSLDPSM